MKVACPIPLAFFLSLGLSHAATIVSLNEADAFYDITGGNVLTTVGDPNHALGLTMNVTFTPNATDIGQTTNAVALLEIGGNANGTGLYMLGGEIYFLSKISGVAANVVAAFDDLDFNSGNKMIGVKSTYGSLVAGTEYSIGVLYDPNGASTLDLGILPTGGSLFTENRNLLNANTTSGAWSGNDTVTSFSEPSNAGGGNTVGGNPFQEGAPMNALSGTAGRALLWNDLGTIIPEPGIFSLLGIAGLFLILRRRH